jgi:hypothetical protein
MTDAAAPRKSDLKYMLIPCCAGNSRNNRPADVLDINKVLSTNINTSTNKQENVLYSNCICVCL